MKLTHNDDVRHGGITLLLPALSAPPEWPSWLDKIRQAKGFVGDALTEKGWVVHFMPASDASEVVREFFDSRHPPKPKKERWNG